MRSQSLTKRWIQFTAQLSTVLKIRKCYSNSRVTRKKNARWKRLMEMRRQSQRYELLVKSIISCTTAAVKMSWISLQLFGHCVRTVKGDWKASPPIPLSLASSLTVPLPGIALAANQTENNNNADFYGVKLVPVKFPLLQPFSAISPKLDLLQMSAKDLAAFDVGNGTSIHQAAKTMALNTIKFIVILQNLLIQPH